MGSVNLECTVTATKGTTKGGGNNGADRQFFEFEFEHNGETRTANGYNDAKVAYLKTGSKIWFDVKDDDNVEREGTVFRRVYRDWDKSPRKEQTGGYSGGGGGGNAPAPAGPEISESVALSLMTVWTNSVKADGLEETAAAIIATAAFKATGCRVKLDAVSEPAPAIPPAQDDEIPF